MTLIYISIYRGKNIKCQQDGKYMRFFRELNKCGFSMYKLQNPTKFPVVSFVKNKKIIQHGWENRTKIIHLLYTNSKQVKLTVNAKGLQI